MSAKQAALYFNIIYITKSVRLSSCQTIKLSDGQVVRLSSCQIVKLSDCQLENITLLMILYKLKSLLEAWGRHLHMNRLTYAIINTHTKL